MSADSVWPVLPEAWEVPDETAEPLGGNMYPFRPVPARDAVEYLARSFPDLLVPWRSRWGNVTEGAYRIEPASWSPYGPGATYRILHAMVTGKDAETFYPWARHVARWHGGYSSEFAVIYWADDEPEATWTYDEVVDLAEWLDDIATNGVPADFWDAAGEIELGWIDEYMAETFLPDLASAVETLLDDAAPDDETANPEAVACIMEWGPDYWPECPVQLESNGEPWGDPDPVAETMVADYLAGVEPFDNGAPDPFKLAPLYDPTADGFDAPDAVGRRAARFNREAAEMRTEALRVGSSFDPFGWAP